MFLPKWDKKESRERKERETNRRQGQHSHKNPRCSVSISSADAVCMLQAMAGVWGFYEWLGTIFKQQHVACLCHGRRAGCCGYGHTAEAAAGSQGWNTVAVGGSGCNARNTVAVVVMAGFGSACSTGEAAEHQVFQQWAALQKQWRGAEEERTEKQDFRRGGPRWLSKRAPELSKKPKNKMALVELQLTAFICFYLLPQPDFLRIFSQASRTLLHQPVGSCSQPDSERFLSLDWLAGEVPLVTGLPAHVQPLLDSFTSCTTYVET